MGMRWVQSHRGRLTRIEWSSWLSGTKPLDPYLIWADLTNGASFFRSDTSPVDKWPLIVELSKPNLRAPDPGASGECADLVRAAAEVPWVFGCLEVSPAYLLEKNESGTKRYYVDGTYITTRAQPEMIEMLLHSEHIQRFQLGLPRLATPVPEPRVRARTVRQAGGGLLARVVVGVIDDGCAFAHPALADADGGTRVRYLWDQDRRRTAGLGWDRLDDFGYGAELGPLTMRNATLAATPDDELEPYKQSQYGHWRLDADTHASRPFDADERPLPPASQLSASHGAAVTHLAAGQPGPLRLQAQGDDLAMRMPVVRWGPSELPGVAAKVKRLAELPHDQRRVADLAAVDAAAQWDLVFVQLPSQTVADTSGGSLAVQVLDGVRYIQQRARRLPYQGAMPEEDADYVDNAVVVNISFGALGGGHDGTSILEMALRERTQAQPPSSTFVTVAAGNGHRNGSHADFELSPDTPSATLIFTVGPDNPHESYLEIWLPDVDVHLGEKGETLAARLLVSVTTPSGAHLPVAKRGQSWQLQAEDDSAHSDAAGKRRVPEAALIWSRRVSQGLRGTMLLLAVGRTRRGVGGPDAVSGEHGDWELELNVPGPWVGETAPQRVHAWCERNDLVYGQRRGQQARVSFDPPPSEPSESHPEAIRFLAEGHRTSPNQRPPHGFRTSSSLSSLAGVPPVPASEAFRPDPQADGRYIVVGGYRLHDGEMSAISSGGPGRHYSQADYWNALQGQRLVAADLRLGPDVDAPSDLGTAVAGLRVHAWWPSSQQRISGTSAAAALATRVVANLAYWRLMSRDLVDVPRTTVDAAEALMSLPARESTGDPHRRPTLTPRADDAFRRGRRRIR
mgnify:CR=1 FL=1